MLLRCWLLWGGVITVSWWTKSSCFKSTEESAGSRRVWLFNLVQHLFHLSLSRHHLLVWISNVRRTEQSWVERCGHAFEKWPTSLLPPSCTRHSYQQPPICWKFKGFCSVYTFNTSFHKCWLKLVLLFHLTNETCLIKPGFKINVKQTWKTGTDFHTGFKWNWTCFVICTKFAVSLVSKQLLQRKQC